MRTRIILLNLLLLSLVFTSVDLAYQGIKAFKNGDNLLNSKFAPRIYRNISYPSADSSLSQQASQMVSQVTPAVVSVFGTKKVTQKQTMQRLYVPMFNLSVTIPQEMIPQTTQITAGSGFFVSPNGYILTNKHVVSDTNSAYSVQLSNGTKLDANVVYRDPAKDLAMLKVSGYNYPTLPLGDSSKLKVGQEVLSIGNAYGQYANTVSTGAVSGLNKSIVAENEGRPQKLNNVIQTSAQLYPGDSGGPTFDLSGNVIGINVATAITEYNVSFSIPINEAKNIIQTMVDRVS